jgi:hypothetical protein
LRIQYRAWVQGEQGTNRELGNDYLNRYIARKLQQRIPWIRLCGGTGFLGIAHGRLNLGAAVVESNPSTGIIGERSATASLVCCGIAKAMMIALSDIHGHGCGATSAHTRLEQT